MQVNCFKASCDVRNAFDCISQKKYSKAINYLEGKESWLGHDEYYWINYGTALKGRTQYKLALEKYNEASKITTTPHLSIDKSRCLKQLGMYEEAVNECLVAINMIPSRIYPKYELLKIYLDKNDIENSVKIADQILQQTPKGFATDKADFFKSKAKKVIDKYGKNY